MELDPALGHESIYQPLKRNHACLQCKKRKVKCDGARPHCAPCLRSHAHACRASNRAGARLPVLLCEWAEPESPTEGKGDEDPLAAMGGADVSMGSTDGYAGSSRDVTPPRPDAVMNGNGLGTNGPGAAARKTSANSYQLSNGHAHTPHTSIAGASAHLNAKKAEREKEKRREEEKELLLARIADLESKLAQMSTAPVPGGSGGGAGSGGNTRSGSIDDIMEEVSSAMNADASAWNGNGRSMASVTTVPEGSTMATGHTAGTAAYNFDAYIQPPKNNAGSSSTAGLLGNGEQNFDFSAFFLVPVNWPRNLPSPYLLEHLIDTFFANVPQAPRMIHKASLMARLHHAPSHEDFPHPSLLHAICASAASYTAWVHALPPEQLEAKVQEMLHTGTDLESIADFALAQAEGARRAIHQSSNVCYWGAGRRLMDVLQAQVLMSEVYSQKGFTMLAWTLASIPVRLIQGLELTNRNIPKRYKLGLLPVTNDPIEKEERLATVWQTYITDAYFAVGSYWMPSMDERDYYCKLPGSSMSFKKGIAEVNPQGPNDEDVYRSHPVADPFVLMCKTAILAMRSARWRWQWSQREISPGDEMSGMQDPEFQKLVRDIYEFQATMPLAIKNIFKLLDDGAHAFDANLLCIHIMPQVTLLMLYEQFADWEKPNSVAIMQMQRAYESVVGIVHLIPSNLDVSIIMNSMMCFAFYVVGRIIADFTFHALERGAFSLAVRHRADLMAIQAPRYGVKSPMGIFMGNFLESYLATLTKGQATPNNQVCRPNFKDKIDDALKHTANQARQSSQTSRSDTAKSPVDDNAKPSANVMPAYAPATQLNDGFLRFSDRTGAISESVGSGSMSGFTPESTTGSMGSFGVNDKSAAPRTDRSGKGEGFYVGPGQSHQDWNYPLTDALATNGNSAAGPSRPSTASNTSPTSTGGLSGSMDNSHNNSTNSFSSFAIRTPDDRSLADIAFATGGSFAPGAAMGGAGHPQGAGWEFGGLDMSMGTNSPGPMGLEGLMGMMGSTGMTPYLNFDTPAPMPTEESEPDTVEMRGPDDGMQGFGLMSGMMSTEQLEYGLQFDRHQPGANAPMGGVASNGSVSPNPATYEHGIPRLQTQEFGAKAYRNLGEDAAKRARVMHDNAHANAPQSSFPLNTDANLASSEDARMGNKSGTTPPMADMQAELFMNQQFATAAGGLDAGSKAARAVQRGRGDVRVSGASDAGMDAARRIQGQHPYVRPMGVGIGVNGRVRVQDPTDASALPRGKASLGADVAANADRGTNTIPGVGNGNANGPSGRGDRPRSGNATNGDDDDCSDIPPQLQRMAGIEGVMGISAAEMSIDDMLSRFDAENRQAQMRSLQGEWQT